ncbi:MAG: hypothetical protein FWE22_06635 [Firmicutes bacterium]|nr:hypothetical protein [Bacillota bacterium]
MTLSEKQIQQIEMRIGYQFTNKNTLVEALTHTSYTHENPHLECNERLEFLGDRVLNLLASEEAYSLGLEKDDIVGIVRTKKCDVGELKEFVEGMASSQPLARAVEKLKLEKYYLCAKGTVLEEKKKSDIFEAVLGAIYHDSRDLDKCRPLLKSIEPLITRNAISMLKEWSESENGKKFEKVVSQKRDKRGLFSCLIIIGDDKFRGLAKKKKDAERKASEKVVKAYNIG